MKTFPQETLIDLSKFRNSIAFFNDVLDTGKNGF